MATPSALRAQVLSLYRRILRAARTWEAPNPSETFEHRDYIRSEASELFRRHASEPDPARAQQYLTEAETRLELALHYGTPYPRPVNLPPGALPVREGRRLGSAQLRSRSRSRPLYTRSEDERSGLR